MSKLNESLAIALWHIGRFINKLRNWYYNAKFEYNYKMSKKF